MFVLILAKDKKNGSFILLLEHSNCFFLAFLQYLQALDLFFFLSLTDNVDFFSNLKYFQL